MSCKKMKILTSDRDFLFYHCFGMWPIEKNINKVIDILCIKLQTVISGVHNMLENY